MDHTDFTLALLKHTCDGFNSDAKAKPRLLARRFGLVPQKQIFLGPYDFGQSKGPFSFLRKPSLRERLLDGVERAPFVKGYIQGVLHLNHSRIGGLVGINHMSEECLKALIKTALDFVNRNGMALALCASDYAPHCEDTLYQEEMLRLMGQDLAMSQGYMALGFATRGLKAGGPALMAAAREIPLPNLIVSEQGAIELMVPTK